MRTIDADTLLNTSWNKLSDTEQVINTLVQDLSTSDHFYEHASDAQSFKNFESALLQIQHRIIDLQAHIGLALKSRTKGMVLLKDKKPPAHGVVTIEHEKPFTKPSKNWKGDEVGEYKSLPTVANCVEESGIKYPAMPKIESLSLEERSHELDAAKISDKVTAMHRTALAKEMA